MTLDKPLGIAERILDTSRVAKPEFVSVRPTGWMKLLVMLCLVVALCGPATLIYMTGNRAVGNSNGDKLDRLIHITCQAYVDSYPDRHLPPDCVTGDK